MDSKQLDALNAYSAAATNVKQGGPAKSAVDPSAEGGSFADMISDSLKETDQAVHSVEEITAKSLQGKADIVDVVTAASNAEVMVQTVVTVRDKMISAYQDVLKMPI